MAGIATRIGRMLVSLAASVAVLALLTMADHGRAESAAQPAAGEARDATLIKDLMPLKSEGASRCFEARRVAGPIDVEDWSKVRWVRVGGQWSGGQPAKMPVAAVKKRKPRRILIQIVNATEEPGASGSLYTLWTSISFEGWKTLYSGANCRYETNRLVFKNGDLVKDERGEYVSEPVTPQISCGVDCDGGGASLFYVDGAKPALKLQFRDGGMRMSGNCSVNNYTVGGEHDPDGQVKASENAPGYLMTEMPAKTCRGLERRAVDAMNDTERGSD